MTRLDPKAVQSFLDAHFETPGALIAAAETVMDPTGPDPDALEASATALEALAQGATSIGASALQRFATILASVARGLASGALDPLGPAAGALDGAARGLEDALVVMEAGDKPDEDDLEDSRARLEKLTGVTPQQPPVEQPPVEQPPPAPAPPPAPSPQLLEVERWGPWDPPYADMEDDYIEEIQTNIDSLQSGLIGISDGAGDEALINDLFRSSHSIKGQSGQMSVQPLEKVAHKLEDVLDLIRQGKLTVTASQTEKLLGVIDALQSMLEQLRDTRIVEHPLQREIQLMEAIMRGEDPAPAGAAPVPAAPSPPAAAQPVEPIDSAAPAPPAPPDKPAPKATPKPAAQKKSTSSTKAQYLRVDFAKIDHVMNLVGDLFINKIKLHDGLVDIDDLQLEVHKLQNIIARSRQTGSAGLDLEPDDAERLMEGIRKLSHEVEAINERMNAATGETDMISADLRDQVMVMRMVPLDAILGRLNRVLFDAIQKENRGHEPGYKKARLVVEGSDAEIDKVISNMLEVPLVHIVRNSVAHGIEPGEERKGAGKQPEGTVRIRAGQQGTRFVIEVEDDGRGLPPDRVREAALAKGIITEEELASMSEREILSLIFKPGFTTAEQADDLKGRGVGLDEVMEKISAIKGTVEVDSTLGRGMKVTLSLPLTLAINTVVLGEVAGELLAIPMAAVESVVRVGESDVEKMGETEVFTLQGQSLPLVRTDELLGMGRSASQRPDQSYVTVMSVGSKRFGLALDRMTGKQDVVVKSLGSLLGEVPIVAGATLLGERCLLILDPMDIAVHLGRAKAATHKPTEPRARARKKKRMLIVEDEPPTRMTLRRIFEEAGLEVHEAEDGLEALEVARNSQFHVVSTDVVMPRMDGYELTKRLRELPAYRNVPIIMISSKGDEPDKRAGFDAGVDHYVVKPFERSELLELIEEVMR